MEEAAGGGTGPRQGLLFTRVLLGGFHLLPAGLLQASSPLCLTHNSAMRSENIPEPPPCSRALCGGRLQGCALSLEEKKFVSLEVSLTLPLYLLVVATACSCQGPQQGCVCVCECVTWGFPITEDNKAGGASTPGSALFMNLGQVGLALCE